MGYHVTMKSGYTFSEVVGVLAVILTLGAIAIPSIQNFQQGSKQGVALRNAAALNSAVQQYDQLGGLLTAQVPVLPDVESIVDPAQLPEMKVLNLLRGGEGGAVISAWQEPIFSREGYRVIWVNGLDDASGTSNSLSGGRSDAAEALIASGQGGRFELAGADSNRMGIIGFQRGDLVVAALEPDVIPNPTTTPALGNRNPVVGLIVDRLIAPVGGDFLFTANASDEDGDPLEYNFIFSGGETGWQTSNTFTRSYSLSGNQRVSVQVRDNRGGQAQDEQGVRVESLSSPSPSPSPTPTATPISSPSPSPTPVSSPTPLPSPAFNGAPTVLLEALPSEAPRGATVTFRATALDPDGDLPLDFRFALNNAGWTEYNAASIVINGNRATVNFTFPSVGNQEVRVQVRDPLKAESQVARASVSIVNRPPTVSLAATPKSSSPNRQITFAALGVDPDGDALLYRFRVDGGSWSDFAPGNTIAPTFATSGTKEVLVQAQDILGALSNIADASALVNATPTTSPTPTATPKPSPGTTGAVFYGNLAVNNANDGKVITNQSQLAAGSVAHNFATVIDTLQQLGLPQVEAALSASGSKAKIADKVIATKVVSSSTSKQLNSLGFHKSGVVIGNGFTTDHSGNWKQETTTTTVVYEDTIERSSWAVANGLIMVENGVTRIFSAAEWKEINKAIADAQKAVQAAKKDLDAKTKTYTAAKNAESTAEANLAKAALRLDVAETNELISAENVSLAEADQTAAAGVMPALKAAAASALKARDDAAKTAKSATDKIKAADKALLEAAKAWDKAVQETNKAQDILASAQAAQTSAQAKLNIAQSQIAGLENSLKAAEQIAKSVEQAAKDATSAYNKLSAAQKKTADGLTKKAAMDEAKLQDQNASKALAAAKKALADGKSAVTAADKALTAAQKSTSNAEKDAQTKQQAQTKAEDARNKAQSQLSQAQIAGKPLTDALAVATAAWENADANLDAAEANLAATNLALKNAKAAHSKAKTEASKAKTAHTAAEKVHNTALGKLGSAQIAWETSNDKYLGAVENAESPTVTVGSSTQKLQAAAAKTGVNKAQSALNKASAAAEVKADLLETAAARYAASQEVVEDRTEMLNSKNAQLVASQQAVDSAKAAMNAQSAAVKAAKDKFGAKSPEYKNALADQTTLIAQHKTLDAARRTLAAEAAKLKTALSQAKSKASSLNIPYVQALTAATIANDAVARAADQLEEQTFWANNIVDTATVNIAGAVGAITDADKTTFTRQRVVTTTSSVYWSPITISFSGQPDFLAGPDAWYKHSERKVVTDALRMFDLDGTGVKPWEWVGPTEGILVWNPAGNALLQPTGKELFGNSTWGKNWENGYEPLATLDVDGNGELSDLELEPLWVWTDTNSDAQVQEGELAPVGSKGITSLGVKAIEENSKIWLPGGAKTSTGTFDTRDWFSMAPAILDNGSIYLWQGEDGLAGGFRFYQSPEFGLIVASLPAPRNGEEMPILLFRADFEGNQIVWRAKEGETELRTVVTLTASGSLEGLTSVVTPEGTTSNKWTAEHATGPKLEEVLHSSPVGQ
jgi:type II secretory pathway pseudopilin PulG/chromosome segregation ATPase